ncbi:MAG: redoxin domain-containing protein [Campylobacterota bacterium]|nr:redoxin domain-containing protein [Campylobacterota bacterium]
MGIFANIISLYKSQDLNKSKLELHSTRLINNTIYNFPNDKPIMLHVWASWCPVCKVEADNIQRVSKYYEVITIAVNSGSDYEISQYLKENDLDFKVINDKNGLLAQELNIAVYPTTFIYDKEKNLVFSEVGYTSSFGLFGRMIYSSFK